MKLALVSPERNEPDPPLGLAYIASYLRKYGNFYNTIIVDKEDPMKRLRREKPDVIGISSMTYDFPRAKVLAEQIKKEFDVPLVIGGNHITLMTHHLQPSAFDIAVIGEGEETMLELVQLYERKGSFEPDDLKRIRGIAFKDGNNIVMTDKRPLIANLDSVPFPARDLLKMKEYYATLRRDCFGDFGVYIHMLTSRGCPYNCAFCSTSVFWHGARFHSAQYVVSEIKELVEKYKVDGIHIWDDLFIARKERVGEIAELLKKEGLKDLKFHVFARANLINEDICNYMKTMNVAVTEFGLESGSEKVLKYLKKGTVTVEQNRSALAMCKRFGFQTLGDMIIGSPDETEEDLRQSLSLIQDKNLDQARVFHLTPYPRTDVWDYAKQKGLVSDSPEFDLRKLNLGGFKENMVLSEKIPPEKLKEWYDVFTEAIRKKNGGENAMRYFKSLKARHIKYMLTKRFIGKMLNLKAEKE
jgi:anaerobic magnesium-protoporphyrin IX monomethyl ester cyclase